MKERISDLVNDITKSPKNMLALGRTIMANERTLLAFTSTSVGLLASGVGLIKLFENTIIQFCGVGLMLASALLFVWGIRRYRNNNKLLRNAHAAMKSYLNGQR
jgi:putative membrane protein